MKSAHSVSRRAALVGIATVVASPVRAKPDPRAELLDALAAADDDTRQRLFRALDEIGDLAPSLRTKLAAFAAALPADPEEAYARLAELWMRVRDL